MALAQPTQDLADLPSGQRVVGVHFELGEDEVAVPPTGKRVHEVGSKRLEGREDHPPPAETVEREDTVGARETELLFVVRKPTSCDHVAAGVHRFRRERDVGVSRVTVARGEETARGPEVRLVQYAFVRSIAVDHEVAESPRPFVLFRRLLNNNEIDPAFLELAGDSRPTRPKPQRM